MAGALDKEKGYWRAMIDSGDRYHPDVYKADYPYDADPKPNPDYKPELDLTLANANMREVFAELGYGTDLEDMPNIPIDEFIARTTQWLQKAIGKNKKIFTISAVTGQKTEDVLRQLYEDILIYRTASDPLS